MLNHANSCSVNSHFSLVKHHRILVPQVAFIAQLLGDRSGRDGKGAREPIRAMFFFLANM